MYYCWRPCPTDCWKLSLLSRSLFAKGTKTWTSVSWANTDIPQNGRTQLGLGDRKQRGKDVIAPRWQTVHLWIRIRAQHSSMSENQGLECLMDAANVARKPIGMTLIGISFPPNSSNYASLPWSQILWAEVQQTDCVWVRADEKQLAHVYPHPTPGSPTPLPTPTPCHVMKGNSSRDAKTWWRFHQTGREWDHICPYVVRQYMWVCL